MNLPLLERARGCLLAGAVGDALGGSVEFASLARIRQWYGPAGIRKLDDRAYGVMGAITDDTQMTLFTTEGLLRARIEGTDSRAVHRAYRRWLKTQGGRVEGELGREAGLIAEPALWQRRAPGGTCLQALSEPVALGDYAANDSKGCGGVMRVAPAAFVVADPDRGFTLGCELARYTHGHPSGYLAAGALVALLRRLIDGETLDTALPLVLARLAAQPAAAEVRAALEQAMALAASATPPAAETVERLGGGWVAEEALAIAVYCALVAPDLEQALILAVNHSGDSDSTGAITGNILGTLLGPAAIPARWLERLELRETIERLADALVEAHSPADPSIRVRQPTGDGPAIPIAQLARPGSTTDG